MSPIRRRRYWLTAATLLVLGACNTPAAPITAKPSPRDLRAAANAVTRAEGLFYGNRYSDSEAAFRDAIRKNPWYADGHAAFGLFLNYQHRFSEAAGEVAQARGLDAHSAYAAAVDTRVRDWSAKDHAALKTDVAVGAEAVRLGPRSAAAHTFYSEVLADTGDAAGSGHEADLAAGLAQTTYEKAEVEREKANLAQVNTDTASQLAHLKAARELQPGWAERTRELAEYYFVAGQSETAVGLVRQAISMAPRDPGLRLTLGSEALLRMDLPLADESFTAANDLKPHDATIESTLAMSHFTLHHDIGEAETLLRAAAADAPADTDIGGLLEGFLRYIKHDGPAADAVTIGRAPREPLDPRAFFPTALAARRQGEQQQALDALNAARAQAHLSPVHIDNRITSGATSHAYWWLFNLSLPAVKGLGIHREVAGTPGFSGVTMRDRSTHFGFPPASMAEDITHRGDPVAAIRDWVDSVYHRFPLMIPTLDSIGFGEASGGNLPIDVLDMGYRNQVGDVRQAVAYPADGQADVPTSFFGNELPDPVPPGGKYPTGYPITVNFNQFTSASMPVAEVRDAAGARLDSYVLPPSTADENVLTILPKAQLAAHTRYRVHVGGTLAGTAFSLDWSFTTAS
jgi:tetratricopeptide (TPR) repeat protein